MPRPFAWPIQIDRTTNCYGQFTCSMETLSITDSAYTRNSLDSILKPTKTTKTQRFEAFGYVKMHTISLNCTHGTNAKSLDATHSTSVKNVDCSMSQNNKAKTMASYLLPIVTLTPTHPRARQHTHTHENTRKWKPIEGQKFNNQCKRSIKQTDKIDVETTEIIVLFILIPSNGWQSVYGICVRVPINASLFFLRKIKFR